MAATYWKCHSAGRKNAIQMVLFPRTEYCNVLRQILTENDLIFLESVAIASVRRCSSWTVFNQFGSARWKAKCPNFQGQPNGSLN